MSIGLVTDSTCYLPDTFLTEQGIAVVDVQVVVDGTSFAETNINLAELAAAVHAGKPTSTSRPAPEQFLATYEEMASRGVREIISVHLSSDLSGTYESALIAAGRASVPVTVIDSRTIGMAMGFAIMAGVQARAQGASAQQIAQTISQTGANSSLWLYVDTLDFLRKGGRISALKFRVGGALAVKPILQVSDGKITHLESVRTKPKALARMYELAAAKVRAGAKDVAVHHVGAPEAAAELAQTLRTGLGLLNVPVTECGAVVAAHTGPGALAIVVCGS